MSLSARDAEDVHFDFAAAAHAVHDLRAAAAVVDQASRGRWSRGEAMLDTWHGRYASEFAAALQTAYVEGMAIAPALSGWAARIEAAIEAAQSEQRRRERARIDYWNGQAAIEEQRASQARETQQPLGVVRMHEQNATAAREHAQAAATAAVARQTDEAFQLAAVPPPFPTFDYLGG